MEQEIIVEEENYEAIYSTDYNDLSNKPKINDVELNGNKSLSDLGIDQDFVKDNNYVHTDNNYTDEEKNKLSTLENYDDTEIKESLNNKVDKISGKGLSSNDFTDTYKNNVDSNTTDRHTHSNKSVLDGISSTDITTWNNKSDFSGNYNDLSNKPTIPDELADLSDDSTHRTVTDTEKTTWNGKQDVLTFDSTPTENSTNPVTSNGIYEALQNAGGGIETLELTSSSMDLLQFVKNNATTLAKNSLFYIHNGLSGYGHLLIKSNVASLPEQDVGISSGQSILMSCTYYTYSTSGRVYSLLLIRGSSDMYMASYSGDSVNNLSISPYIANHFSTRNDLTNLFATTDANYLQILPTVRTLISNTLKSSSNWYNTDGLIATAGAIQKYVTSQTGTLSNLTTTDKTSLVNAINEINSGGGSSTDVQINGTSIVSSGIANILTNTAYDSSTNKIATMSDIPSVDVITSSTSTYTIASLTGNKSYKLGEITSLTITATTTFDEETVIYFDSGSTGTSISIPDTLTNLGDVPTLTTASNVSTGTCDTNKSYIVAVLNNIAVWRKY